MPRYFPLFLAALATLTTQAHADLTLKRSYPIGSPEEQSALFKNLGSQVKGSERVVSPRGGWAYRFVVPPGARCFLSFHSNQRPAVDVTGFDLKPIQSRHEGSGAEHTIVCTAPAAQPVGSAVRYFLHSPAPFSVSDVRLTMQLPDANGDGVPDAFERIMGLAPQERATAIPAPPKPHTSFQTGGPYKPEIAVPTDAALNYSSDAAQIKSWREAGYTVQTMGGFRDSAKYGQEHPDEVQRDVNGQPIEIGGSPYLVPTPARAEIAKQYYRAALMAGSTAVCPEEPEFWSRGGYEEAFKQEWQARYGSPWQAPHSSIDARYRAEQLKGFLETRMISSILADARRIKPSATRMVAVHSPVTYYQWGIPVPHYSLFKLPDVDEIIGQVWTGTARTPVRSAGVRAERTFEVALLEYSSLYNLTRGSGKRMWFLMDPVEDNPSLPMTDYHKNYEETLLASLMFPVVDSYEVMPWPGRIYGRVPADYATEINTVVGALADMWQYGGGTIEAGSSGIGTFVSDSMGWQREQPGLSDYDGFYGLCLPLVLHGVPVDVLSLDRVTEPRYLDREKTLLISYDFLKPTDPAINKALADWVRRGGSLIVVGGTDAFDAVSDSWWRKAGLRSPVDDLFTQLGIQTQKIADVRAEGGAAASGGPSVAPADFITVIKAEGFQPGRRNRGQYDLDLTPYSRQSGSVALRFEDETPQDGNGPALYSAELRIGGKLAASFRAGSELETRFMEEESGSRFNGEARFADRSAYWVYRFDNLPKDTPVTVSLDMANGFLVKAAPAAVADPVLKSADKSVDRTLASLRLRSGYSVTLYNAPAAARPVYTVAGQASPAVWEVGVGSGSVTFAGVSPGYLTATAQSSRWMRMLVKRAFEKSGGQYHETTSYVVRRGPYVGVRALGKEASLDGHYVDLLNPSLPLVDDPTIPPRGVGLFSEIGKMRGAPKVLAVSGRLRARSEQPGLTGFVVQGPAKTTGAVRIWSGRRRIAGAKAFTVFGEPVTATFESAGESLLVHFQHEPEGVIVRVGWK